MGIVEQLKNVTFLLVVRVQVDCITSNYAILTEGLRRGSLFTRLHANRYLVLRSEEYMARAHRHEKIY